MRNPHWAVDRAAELVALQVVASLHSVDVREVVGGIEDAVADVLECVAVILVGAAASDDVDHAAGVLAVLGVVVAGLYAELLQDIREWKGRVDVGVLVDVVAAVQHVVHLVGARSVDGHSSNHRERLGRPLIDVGAGCDDDAGDELGHGCGVTAVQGKIVDALLVDDLGERSGCCIDLWRCSADGDDLCGGADLHGNVYGEGLIGLQPRVAGGVGCKSLGDGCYGVLRRRERGEAVHAGAVAGGGRGLVRAGVGCRDLSAGDRGPCGVGDGAANASEALRGCACAPEQRGEGHCE